MSITLDEYTSQLNSLGKSKCLGIFFRNSSLRTLTQNCLAYASINTPDEMEEKDKISRLNAFLISAYNKYPRLRKHLKKLLSQTLEIEKAKWDEYKLGNLRLQASLFPAYVKCDLPSPRPEKIIQDPIITYLKNHPKLKISDIHIDNKRKGAFV